MSGNQTRRQIVARAVQARRPGLSQNRPAPRGPGIAPNTPAGKGPGIGPNRAFPPLRGGIPAPGGAAPNPAAPTPTPWNTKAEQIVAGANKKYLDSSGNFDLQEQQAKQDFGLDPGFNDYKSNPNSRAALLEQTYLTANRGTMNSAGLQLYSGSTSNRLGGNRANYSANRDQLAKSYRDALGEIGAGRLKAAEEKAEAEREAEWERIAAAEGVEPEAEAAPAPGGKKRPKRRKPAPVAPAVPAPGKKKKR